jgi:dihydroorotase
MSLEFLSQVRVLDPVAGSDRICDVILNQGKIQAIAPSLSKPDSAEVLKIEGAVLGPGLVDLYSRSGEPGHEDRETLTALLQGAIAGGFTQVNLLPNTLPALDNPGQVNWMREKVNAIATTSQIPQVNFWGALTMEVAGKQLCEFAELKDQVIGFSDSKPIATPLMLRRTLEYLQTFGKPLMLWPCDPELTGKGSIRDGVNALKYGLPGIPGSAETVPLAMILELLREIPTSIHVMRISTARSVSMIASAKAEGLPITASVPWHHLLLDTTALKDYDPRLRLTVPLGNPADRKALVQGIKSGVIDAIAVDHSAYTYEEKTVAFSEAPMGAIGYELALSALWSGLVETGELSAIELWRSLSQNPTQCLNQSPESLKTGSNQSLVLFNPNQSWSVNAETSIGNNRHNTHLFGQTMQGKVVKIIPGD